MEENQTGTQEAPPEPNIRWTADPKNGEPPPFVQLGITYIKLPPADEQRLGFYSPHARRLARAVPGFKLITKLGG